MNKYIDTTLRQSSQVLYEIATLDTDTEIELQDDIFISYYEENPWKIEVREGIDGSTKEYDISNGFEKLIADYGDLIIESIR
jgi:hypothetical protein